MLDLAGKTREVLKKPRETAKRTENDSSPERSVQQAAFSGGKKPRELVVISGKGGTGKTSIAASFAALAHKTLISDCDVDAADLHLILRPRVKQKGTFSGGVSVEIDPDRCTACGRCMEACGFSAVSRTVNGDGKAVYSIDAITCEGCGVCMLVCEEGAIRTEDAINGEWYISVTRFGPMSHAKLGVAEENSGRLVSLVRDKAWKLANEYGISEELIDGSPGTGCPVIASLTGADYALIVTEPTVSGIHDMERVFDVTRHFNIPAGVVVNKYDLNARMTERIKDLTRQKGCEFMGTVPYDGSVTRAQMKKLSVVEYEDGPVTQSIKDIWRKVAARTDMARR
ncbi:MAG: 4Fe-4S dicluster domain-containing protein [Candidatus Omnitrophica bacterium]|nr:4Fe-4S dicluster domain-containing protein [Candidatus Omnitrophota bacterium]